MRPSVALSLKSIQTVRTQVKYMYKCTVSIMNNKEITGYVQTYNENYYKVQCKAIENAQDNKLTNEYLSKPSVSQISNFPNATVEIFRKTPFYSFSSK